MPSVTFTSTLKDDGSLTIPAEAAQQLNLNPGDEVQVSVEATNRARPIEDSDQAALQAKFERFFQRLDTLTFEKPTRQSGSDQAEVSFANVMDEKYRKLGFK